MGKSGSEWSDEEKALIIRLVGDGLLIKSIQPHFSKRTPLALRKQINKMNLRTRNGTKEKRSIHVTLSTPWFEYAGREAHKAGLPINRWFVRLLREHERRESFKDPLRGR